MNLDELNDAAEDAFVHQLGGIFEHSPWIVREAAKKRPFASKDGLFQAMAVIVASAGAERQEALIRAHPRLGTAKIMTEQSGEEQKTAGLCDLPKGEAEQLKALNQQYEARFDMPFIMAVRGKSKAAIVAALKERLMHARADEFNRALAEIIKIARFRLDDVLEATKQ
ncbi:2-oxo-4-hydroxy-4-carboxy-5-ureidoimidazoline decarboxylase [Sporolactobacillus inulinus]|uniref:2-oxo-4-hydroxy-4-carboxy-5-ureidoimidazoline decarboxylase n=2 Tax=Sporolactobacillus inulinus TaxID=2078 RepID=A0A4Y3T5I9_9BACL|nr:2-oxo-4-hydroxy-4-carboxy-5-ureidoimidazoline decarboxylase [Sporolactobacillus inulinus]KLI03094.1 OHCU decarboxylase [Sporolactobacillus inulinus CASD]GAY78088.1 2-oxo-4-hydroxy-4-carboxy-5-ureidoimidazoline (OHCU) decarboxylase [Sporolactobacillus inulinus]GEB77272.1 uricase [Sporolactobacillus inulinus]